jgi:DedD protein
MDQAHKQRLVGAIVLTALGLILIPTILDFSQDKPSELAESKIPEAPDVMKMEVLPLEVWSERIDPEIDSSNRIVETPAPVAEPTEKSEPVAEPPPAKPVAEAKPKSKPASSKPVIASGASAWVVQVASFTDEPKAFKLRDRMRKAGHPTFVERHRSDKGMIYRVKVGPVLQRNEADRLKKQIAKEVKLDGLVLKYQ